MENRSYQLTSAGQFAHVWQIGWHQLADKSYFPCERIFISSFSEPLGISIESLNSILLGIQLFIEIYFDGLCIYQEVAVTAIRAKLTQLPRLELVETNKYASSIRGKFLIMNVVNQSIFTFELLSSRCEQLIELILIE